MILNGGRREIAYREHGDEVIVSQGVFPAMCTSTSHRREVSDWEPFGRSVQKVNVKRRILPTPHEEGKEDSRSPRDDLLSLIPLGGEGE